MDTEINNKNYLELIFKSAERRMTEFNMPLANEGKFEVLMYGIWFGIKALDEFGIREDNQDLLLKVNDFLVNYAVRLGIAPDKKAERLFILRDEEWDKETRALAHSNYPYTKQYLPKYLYMCFVDSPLVMYSSSVELCRRAEQIDASDLIKFLSVFENYFNKLIEDYKDFESDANSYKSQAKLNTNQETSEEESKMYKSVYEDFEQEIIERINVKDPSKLSLENMLFMPSYSLGMLDRLVMETTRSFKILDMSNGVNSIINLLEKDLDYLQKNRNGVVEFAKPMLEKDIETRKRCVSLLRSLDKDKYSETKEELESVITKGEEMLNQLLKSVDSGLKYIDSVIELKSKPQTSHTPKKTSKTGCLSVFIAIIILTTLSVLI